MKESKKVLREHARDAARAFLRRIGMQELDVDCPTAHGKIPIVLDDEGTFVYVKVLLNGEKEPDIKAVRRYRQQLHDYMDERRLVGGTRFDLVAIRVIAEDRALLRHHRAFLHINGTSGGV